MIQILVLLQNKEKAEDYLEKLKEPVNDAHRIKREKVLNSALKRWQKSIPRKVYNNDLIHYKFEESIPQFHKSIKKKDLKS